MSDINKFRTIHDLAENAIFDYESCWNNTISNEFCTTYVESVELLSFYVL